MIDRYKLISFASEFVSFIMQNKTLAEKIKNIILFGSVASDNFDEESDIDLFIDLKKYDKDIEKDIRKELYSFNKSRYAEYWRLKSLKNEISLRIGELDKWKKLKRTIETNSITLYGKYTSLPKKLRHFLLIKIKTPKIPRTKQVSFWRALYGYSQKVGKKIYKTKGMVSESKGRKIEKGVILLPFENSKIIFKFLDERRINYETYEFWSDVV